MTISSHQIRETKKLARRPALHEPRSAYQIRTRSAGARYSVSPGFTSNELYQASMLRTVSAAILRRRVRVGHDLLTQCCIARLRRVVLSERDEELLIAEKPSCSGAVLPFERRLVAVIRSRDAGDVGDVFRQYLLAVQVQIGEGLIRVVLCCELCGGCLEVRQVGRRPPIAQTALWSRKCCLRCRRCG